MAAQAIKSAIPSHLKPGNGDAEAEFTGKHHGKTRSHMVSLECPLYYFLACLHGALFPMCLCMSALGYADKCNCIISYRYSTYAGRYHFRSAPPALHLPVQSRRGPGYVARWRKSPVDDSIGDAASRPGLDSDHGEKRDSSLHAGHLGRDVLYHSSLE